MKILVVFYSLTGKTKLLAQAVAAAAKGELAEIKLAKELPRNIFFKYFAAGRQLMKKELPATLPLGKDPAGYDLIFVGTPTWAATFVPAVGSFLAQAKLQNKKVALFNSRGGEDPGLALGNLEKELAGNDIVGKVGFRMDGISVAAERENLRKAAEWAASIVQS